MAPPISLTLDNAGTAIAKLTDSFIRAGIHQPAMRAEIEQKTGRSIDWDALLQRDATEGMLVKAAVQRYFPVP